MIACALAWSCGSDDDGGIQKQNENQNLPACGNGVVEEGEACDDGAVNSDLAPGACRIDCREASCGDGVVDPGEKCDGEGLADATCEAFGYGAGPITCRTDCTADTAR